MSNYKEGAIHQLADQIEKAGFTDLELRKLGETSFLRECLGVIQGRREIVWKKHLVDLAASPKPPFNGATELPECIKQREKLGKAIIELRSDDNLYLNDNKIILDLSERQMGDNRIVGHELREELESGEQVLLNSNVLDYLYEHPELFPEHWKKDENGDIRFIYFWGSIFRSPSDGRLYVRRLAWDDGVLDRDYQWLGNDWYRRYPSASVAS